VTDLSAFFLSEDTLISVLDGASKVQVPAQDVAQCRVPAWHAQSPDLIPSIPKKKEKSKAYWIALSEDKVQSWKSS
jgi:hypothetical protein